MFFCLMKIYCRKVLQNLKSFFMKFKVTIIFIVVLSLCMWHNFFFVQGDHASLKSLNILKKNLFKNSL